MPETFTTISPIDNSIYVERCFSTRQEIDSALQSAQASQAAWKKVPLEKRKAICLQAIDTLVAQKEQLANEICWQMGRPVRYAAGEIDGMEERARTMIELSDQGLASIQLAKKPGFERWIQREPLGVVLLIAPWNYPYLTAINTVIPALLAGNCVIVKHSTQTPLCAERLVQAFHSTELPSGVFQFLHLTHEDTETVIQNKIIKHVAFTGSEAGGAMVKKATLGRFIGLGLELGGKDPAYIRADANLDDAVQTVMDGVFFNSGQSCCAIERIYVHNDLHDEFVSRAVQWAETLKLGRSDDPETTLGPLVRSSAAEFVRQQVTEAIHQGAVPHISSDRYPLDKPGSPYVAPQILTRVNHSMRVMSEESFGPVVGIQLVSSDEEAVRLMNDSEYGLTAAMFTTNIDQGIQLGQQLDTGTFFINRCDYLDPDLAWCGIKNSGHGCSLSVLGYETLTRPKSFHIKTTL